MESTLNELRRAIVGAVAEAQEGHIPSALSVLDILWVLYDRIVRIDPACPDQDDRDRFILSKGHASIGLYAVLAKKGFFPNEWLKALGRYSSPLGGHPDRNKVPGVEASTGSLGHGFPMSVGVALGLRIRERPNRVFCLIGDGEANEGSIWESALLAAHHSLTNLCCIIDYNHSTDRAVQLGDVADKFRAFGWESLVVNGHDHDELYETISRRHDSRPVAVIAETVKGKGIERMTGNPAWHHRSPSPDELRDILKELS